MQVLGIETSCDETGAAVIEANPGDKTVKLLSNVVASSLSLHAKTGGIIPEVAAREQLKYIIPVIGQALKNAKLFALSSPPSIDAIAVTVGPGLIGSLLVGVETAKTLAYVWGKPIIPVNHLIGHIYANFIQTTDDRIQKTDIRKTEYTESLSSVKSVQSGIRPPSSVLRPPNFPAIALVVSGGHTDLVLMKGHQRITWIGGTLDDAAGEAFDKIGRLLGLPYPGGPAIAKAAEKGNPKAFGFPRPMIDSDDFDFSFSGLKTAVLREVKNNPLLTRHSGKRSASRIPTGNRFWTSPAAAGSRYWRGQNDNVTNNLCASIQQAIVDVLVAKTIRTAKKYKAKTILLGGGVAANEKLREKMKLEIGNWKLEIPLSVPPKELCTDNGAMIATAAFFNYQPIPWQKITANPNLHF